MERMGNTFFFLGRVIERTARGYSVESKVHPGRDRCAWRGRLETRVDSKCEEDTNDRVTGRAGERETSRVKDSRGKAVVHVPGACRHHVQREGNSKEDHMFHRKRRDAREAYREIPERCPERKVFDRHIPTVRERVHRQRLDRTTPNVQEHKWWSYAVEKRNSFCMVKNTAVSESEFCRGRIIRLDNWNFRRDGDEAPLERTGIRSDSREPCQQPICEGMGNQTRFGTDETCHVEVHVRARRRGEEADDTCLCKHELKQGRLDDKVSY